MTEQLPRACSQVARAAAAAVVEATDTDPGLMKITLLASLPERRRGSWTGRLGCCGRACSLFRDASIMHPARFASPDIASVARPPLHQASPSLSVPAPLAGSIRPCALPPFTSSSQVRTNPQDVSQSGHGISGINIEWQTLLNVA